MFKKDCSIDKKSRAGIYRAKKVGKRQRGQHSHHAAARRGHVADTQQRHVAARSSIPHTHQRVAPPTSRDEDLLETSRFSMTGSYRTTVAPSPIQLTHRRVTPPSSKCAMERRRPNFPERSRPSLHSALHEYIRHATIYSFHSLPMETARSRESFLQSSIAGGLLLPHLDGLSLSNLKCTNHHLHDTLWEAEELAAMAIGTPHRYETLPESLGECFLGRGGGGLFEGPWGLNDMF